MKKYYDTSSYDETLLRLRRTKRYRLKRLLAYLIDKIPVADEMLLLNHICQLLDKNRLSYSRRELKTCYEAYYDDRYHLPKQKSDLYKKSVLRLFENTIMI